MGDVDLDALERDVDAAECLGRAEAMALIAELRRLLGQTCETCKSCDVSGDYVRIPVCSRLGQRCDRLGHGCRAHEPKAGA